jgi:hypothetical protein
MNLNKKRKLIFLAEMLQSTHCDCLNNYMPGIAVTSRCQVELVFYFFTNFFNLLAPEFYI